MAWTPFQNGTYVTFIGLMQSKKLQEIIDEVQETCIPLVAEGLKIFVPADMIAYGLIPQQNRLLWVDIVDIIWIVILATKANEVAKKKEVA